jgi:adenylate cyclase
MAEKGFKRKLTAILSADVEGYSRLMGEDEEATVRTLTAYREVLYTLIQQHNGQVLDSPGDNLLADFVSVVDAVQCAVAVQKEFKARNNELPENRRMQFRIGINLGDVIQEKGRIYGDGVNIAARLESLAEPGGICISKTAFDHIESKLPYGYDFIGDQTVKNIAKPVGAYRVLMDPRVTVSGKPVDKKPAAIRRTPILVGAGAMIVLAIAVGIWQFYMRRPTVEPASVAKMAFPLPDKPSIAVLPFDNLSGDPEQEYFSDGITDDLITDLSKISGLFVVARNSSFLYKGQSVKIQKVAEDLGIRYVLEGSVRKAGDKIRINAQLIDAITGGHLWAERYDRDYKDIFRLQDEVIERIVFALSVKLTQKEKEQLARKYTENLEAYDYYLSGAQALYSYSVKGLAKARSMFQKAIDLDPKFAQAYAAHAMASSYIFRYSPTVRIEDDRIQAFEFATKALALDSSLPMAHTVLAGIHIIYRRFDEAITSADKAVDLDPNNADSHVMRAHVLTHIGRHEESQKALNTAFRLNPNPPPYYYFELGLVQFNLKQYAEAIKSIKKSGDIIPDWLRSRVLAPSYAYLGRLDEARAELKKIVKVAWNFKLRYVSHPYVSYRKLEEDDKHWYEGFRRAGLQDPPDNYRRSMDDIVENMLSGKEIKDLAVGRTWSGFNPGGGDQWWISFTNDGKLPTRGAWGIESGSYRIEEFRICWKWQEPLPRQDGCGFVYPNPKGTVEEKNQYEWVTRYFVHPFSIEE